MILTLKELAEYLRVNERTILRMLNTGKISGVKIGGQWRFNGSQIDQVFFPNGKSEVYSTLTQDEPGSVLTRPAIGIPVSRVMSEERVLLNMKATDVESAIAELTDARLMNGLVLDVTDLRKKCLEREEVLSTGVGEGIALPHPRDPIATLKTSAAIVYGYSKDGIDFKAADGKPVHIFFLICSQNIELHMHLMGCLARMLRDANFVKALPKCKASADVIKLVMKYERDEFLARENA